MRTVLPREDEMVFYKRRISHKAVQLLGGRRGPRKKD